MKQLNYIIFCILLMLGGCKGSKKNTPGEWNELVAVTLAPVEEIITSESIETSGQVKAREEITLSFKTGGIIRKIYVEEGQRIRKGQLLGSLDLTEIGSQINQIQANVEKTERDLNRAKSLFADSAATLEQVQNLTTAYTLGKENLKAAQFNLTYSEITSTCEGIVARKWKNEGEMIAQGNPVFTILESGSNHWVVKTGITDKDRVRVQLKDQATIHIEAYPNQKMNGFISQLAEMPDPFTGLYTIEISLDSTSHLQLASGYFASVQLIPSQMNRYTVVPIEALTEGIGKKAFVYTTEASTQKAIKKEVLISHIDNQKAYIISGLEGVNEVVVQGNSYLENGTQVSPAK